MGGDYWLRHIRCLYWGYRILRHKEGLGYGDVKFSPPLVPGIHGPSCHDWFSFCLIRLRSRSYWSAHERKRIIKNPLPFGPFLAAAGFVVGWIVCWQAVNL